MSSDIIITEKSSQARDVRTALGTRYGPILPAEGHLIMLREPEEVNPEWKRWTPVLLRPEGLFGTKPAPGGNKPRKLKAIKDALRSASRVLAGHRLRPRGPADRPGDPRAFPLPRRGDAGHVHRPGPKDHSRRLRQREAEHGVRRTYAAAVARQQSDQIYNLSLTRTATVSARPRRARGHRRGRVKTPTLAIVCRRELKIRAFHPQAYFEVVATALAAGGTFLMRHAPQEKILKRYDAG